VHSFYLCSLGPDPLFYYMLPIRRLNHDSASKGSDLHRQSAFPFLKKGYGYIEDIGDPYKKLILRSYLMGFLSHYILDSSAHPFINDVSKGQLNGHKILEMNIDTLLLQRYEGEHSQKFDFDHYMKIDSSIINTVADMFSNITGISAACYKKSVDHMRITCNLFRDRFGILKKTASVIEFFTGKKGSLKDLFYCDFMPNRPDHLNLQKKLHERSFPEIFENALVLYIEVQEHILEEKYFKVDFGGKPNQPLPFQQ
jgi:hypothetical protein